MASQPPPLVTPLLLVVPVLPLATPPLLVVPVPPLATPLLLVVPVPPLGTLLLLVVPVPPLAMPLLAPLPLPPSPLLAPVPFRVAPLLGLVDCVAPVPDDSVLIPGDLRLPLDGPPPPPPYVASAVWAATALRGAVKSIGPPWEVARVVRVTTGTPLARERLLAAVAAFGRRGAANFGFDFGVGKSGGNPATTLATLVALGDVTCRFGALFRVAVVISAAAATATMTIEDPIPSNTLAR